MPHRCKSASNSRAGKWCVNCCGPCPRRRLTRPREAPVLESARHRGRRGLQWGPPSCPDEGETWLGNERTGVRAQSGAGSIWALYILPKRRTTTATRNRQHSSVPGYPVRVSHVQTVGSPVSNGDPNEKRQSDGRLFLVVTVVRLSPQERHWLSDTVVVARVRLLCRLAPAHWKKTNSG